MGMDTGRRGDCSGHADQTRSSAVTPFAVLVPDPSVAPRDESSRDSTNLRRRPGDALASAPARHVKWRAFQAAAQTSALSASDRPGRIRAARYQPSDPARTGAENRTAGAPRPSPSPPRCSAHQRFRDRASGAVWKRRRWSRDVPRGHTRTPSAAAPSRQSTVAVLEKRIGRSSAPSPSRPGQSEATVSRIRWAEGFFRGPFVVGMA